MSPADVLDGRQARFERQSKKLRVLSIYTILLMDKFTILLIHKYNSLSEITIISDEK